MHSKCWNDTLLSQTKRTEEKQMQEKMFNPHGSKVKISKFPNFLNSKLKTCSMLQNKNYFKFKWSNVSRQTENNQSCYYKPSLKQKILCFRLPDRVYFAPPSQLFLRCVRFFSLAFSTVVLHFEAIPFIISDWSDLYPYYADACT